MAFQLEVVSIIPCVSDLPSIVCFNGKGRLIVLHIIGMIDPIHMNLTHAEIGRRILAQSYSKE